MKRVHGFLIATLLLASTGCAMPTPEALLATPSPSTVPSLTPSPSPTPVSTPTDTPTPVPPSRPTATPIALLSPLGTPTAAPPAEAGIAGSGWPDPPARPFDWVVVNAEPPRRVPNAVRSFWVTQYPQGRRRQISARLRIQTPHAQMWVEEGVWHDVRTLEDAAWFFENRIYTSARAVFGSEWTPGVDNDPHILVLHATGLGGTVAGYASGADEFPRALHPFSNEAELITVNLDTLGVGTPDYYATLAAQFQRLIQWASDRNEARWAKEGLAQLAMQVSDLGPGCSEAIYLSDPDTSLTNWSDGGSAAQRAAACLFATYFHERFGNPGVRAWVSQPINGPAGISAALDEIGAEMDFEGLFANWLVANYLDSVAPAEDGPYRYASLDLPLPTLAATYSDYPVNVAAAVKQYGSDYIVLQADDDLHVEFTGAMTASLLDVVPHSGRYFWWSNQSDESLMTLARDFDLSEVDGASLTYRAWYDIEPGYDYAFVEISIDRGKQWQMLSTPSGTDENPHGNNPGWGYTGRSGDGLGWIEERVDLTPYVGATVRIRFSYLTDEAITGKGLVLDDIGIPEIGYLDEVEVGDGGWEATGFVHSDGSVDQRYMAVLVGPENPPVVERLPIAADQTANWLIPLKAKGWPEAILVLSGLAPVTTESAPYQLSIGITGEKGSSAP